MARALEHYVTFIHRYKDTGEYAVFLPKTVAEYVITRRNETAADHVASSDVHLTEIDRRVLDSRNKPFGIITLDENGKIPIEYFEDSIVAIRREAKDIDELLGFSTVQAGFLVMVLNASKDKSVHGPGWAVYRRTTNPEFNDLKLGWEKLFSKTSMDMPTDYDSYKELLNFKSTPEEIDEAVDMRHSHENMTTLVELKADGNRLTYKGEVIAYTSDISRFVFDDDVIIGVNDDEKVHPGDVWIKISIGQRWWNDESVEYGGTTMYERYYTMKDLEDAPLVRTFDAVSFRRCFAECHNLKNAVQYDVRNSTDFQEMYKNCYVIQSIPDMACFSGLDFDNMFYGCAMLEKSPELSMVKPTTMIGIFNGCSNLKTINPLGNISTSKTFREFASGCSSLEVIAQEFDFSSIDDHSGVQDMFKDCIELWYLRFAKGTLKYSIDLSDTNLNMDSIQSVLNGLAKVDPEDEKYVNLQGVETANLLDEVELRPYIDLGWTFMLDHNTYKP